MEKFLPPLIGGILIGLSSTMILFFLGKIAGVSGILGSFLSIFGAQFNIFLASVRSGFLFKGSSSGNSLYLIFDSELRMDIREKESKGESPVEELGTITKLRKQLNDL